jgi:hypothetical protein
MLAEAGELPVTDDIFFASIIKKCWNGEYASMEALQKDVLNRLISNGQLSNGYNSVFSWTGTVCAAAPRDTKRQYKVQYARLREAVRPQRSTSFRTANHGQLGEAIPGRGPLVLSNNDPKGTGRIREETAQRRWNGLGRKQPKGDITDQGGNSLKRIGWVEKEDPQHG